MDNRDPNKIYKKGRYNSCELGLYMYVSELPIDPRGSAGLDGVGWQLDQDFKMLFVGGRDIDTTTLLNSPSL